MCIRGGCGGAPPQVLGGGTCWGQLSWLPAGLEAVTPSCVTSRCQWPSGTSSKIHGEVTSSHSKRVWATHRKRSALRSQLSVLSSELLSWACMRCSSCDFSCALLGATRRNLRRRLGHSFVVVRGAREAPLRTPAKCHKAPAA